MAVNLAVAVKGFDFSSRTSGDFRANEREYNYLTILLYES